MAVESENQANVLTELFSQLQSYVPTGESPS